MPVTFDGVSDAASPMVSSDAIHNDHYNITNPTAWLSSDAIHNNLRIASRWTMITFWILSALIGLYALFGAVSGGAHGIMEILHLTSLGFLMIFASFMALQMELHSTNTSRRTFLLKAAGYFFYSNFLFYPIPRTDETPVLWSTIFVLAGLCGFVLTAIQVYFSTIGGEHLPLRGRGPLRPPELSETVDAVKSGVTNVLEHTDWVMRDRPMLNPFSSSPNR